MGEKRSKAVSLLHDALAQPQKLDDLYFLSDSVACPPDKSAIELASLLVEPTRRCNKHPSLQQS